jgi:polyphosphate kinase
MKEEKRYINREISWLSFNERVLQEAEDKTVPLIERLRFLGIFSNNLDEFFRIRVATVKRMAELGQESDLFFGAPPKKLFSHIHEIVLKQIVRFNDAYKKILAALEKHNVFIINANELNAEQGKFVKNYFNEKVRPHLVPLMLQKKSVFPYLRDKSIYLIVKLVLKKAEVDTIYSIIDIPTDILPRFIILPSSKRKKCIIILDDIIRFCLKEIFHIYPFESASAYTVKLTRDAELDIDNDISQSFIENLSRSLKNRKKGAPVRLLYDEKMPADLHKFIIHKLNIDKTDVLMPGGKYHNFKDFMNFPDVGNKSLEYKPMPPLMHSDLEPNESILKKIKQKDIFLHFPYQSFSLLIDLLREAAIDPHVVSIKITLYRVAKKYSQVINTLINAARNGKAVTVLLELQARFDESNNIYWSDTLKEYGVKVIFGVPGLKVHSKLLLIERNEGGKLVQYANITTGNYNEETARLYSDVAILTANSDITTEVNNMFTFFEHNYLTFKYKHLIVSPFQMRSWLIYNINREIRNVRSGKDAYIIFKMNNLIDLELIDKLYSASNAGVKIKIIIRGVCSLIPGIPGMSENIEAISIVDRFLEHSRIYVFCNDNDPEYYISSADLMTRNIDFRVEVSCPVYDNNIKRQLKNILDIEWKDNVKARIMDAKQKNKYRETRSRLRHRSQFETYKYFKQQLFD